MFYKLIYSAGALTGRIQARFSYSQSLERAQKELHRIERKYAEILIGAPYILAIPRYLDIPRLDASGEGWKAAGAYRIG